MAQAYIEYPVGKNGQRGVTLVDLDTAEWIAGRTLSLSAQGYARLWIDGTPRTIHRIILGLPIGGKVWGDHINRNKLDNRRTNLRRVTPAESAANRGNRRTRTGTSRGVFLEGARWRAQAQLNGKFHLIGYYDTEVEAEGAAREWRIENMPGFIPPVTQ